jgi:transcription-repair coupling factor (superfamily II helicase)
VEIYRSISEIEDLEKLESLSAEIADRYGDYPEAIINLLDLSACRILLSELGAERLSLKNGRIFMEFREDKSFTKSEIEGWRKRIQGKMEFKSAERFALELKLEKSDGNLLKQTLMSLLGRSSYERHEHSAAK